MHKLDGIAELEAACMREHFNLARGNGSNAPSEKVSHLLKFNAASALTWPGKNAFITSVCK